MKDDTIRIDVDPLPGDDALRGLWLSAWGDQGPQTWQPVLQRSLGHLGAFDGNQLIGFVNIAWDGGIHAFILDTSVHKDFQRRGIALRLLEAAKDLARQRGAQWLHVDFEPHLTPLYRAAGFRQTDAGLVAL